jgi:hypothetical protein
MNQEELEKVASSRLTRRTIVSTGTKLAYAAPVVAASMKLSTSSAFATHTPGHEAEGECFHSIEPGCKPACKAGTGSDAIADVNDNSDPCEQVCSELCPIGTEDRACTCADACDPESFTLLPDGDVRYTGECGTVESNKFP